MNETKNFSFTRDEFIAVKSAVMLAKYVSAIAGCKSNFELYNDIEHQLTLHLMDYV